MPSTQTRPAPARPDPTRRAKPMALEPIPFLRVPREPELRGPAPRRVRWRVGTWFGVGALSLLAAGLGPLPWLVTFTKRAELATVVFPALALALLAVLRYVVLAPVTRGARLLTHGRVCTARILSEESTLGESVGGALQALALLSGHFGAGGSSIRRRRVDLRIQVSADAWITRSATFNLDAQEDWCEAGALVTVLVDPRDDRQFAVYAHAQRSLQVG